MHGHFHALFVGVHLVMILWQVLSTLNLSLQSKHGISSRTGSWKITREPPPIQSNKYFHTWIPINPARVFFFFFFSVQPMKITLAE